MRLHTTATSLLGIRVPVLSAPMTPQAGGKLARAVSDAGAFGMLGFDEDEGAESIQEQLAILARGKVHFGIGLVVWVLERRPELLDWAIAARPKLVSISFGDPAPYVQRLHEAGILVASQVQDRAWAQKAIDAGVDVIVAQGTEAGGHTGRVGTLPLLQMVLEMTDKPVLAAGGIVNGRGVAAVLAAGAAGAWIGTPFLVANESRTNPKAQDVILASDETQTIYTSVFDRAQHKGWTPEFRGRALRNPFAERWDQHEEELERDEAALSTYEEAKRNADYATAHIYAGQTVGALERKRSAGEVIAQLERETIEYLERARSLIV